MEEGCSVLIRFPDDARPHLWQERVLLARVTKAVWICATPDLDIEELDLEQYQLRVLPRNRALPPGVRERDCYLVFFDHTPDTFIAASDLKGLMEEGQAQAAIARAARGLSAESSSGGAGASAPSGAAVGLRRRLIGKQRLGPEAKQLPVREPQPPGDSESGGETPGETDLVWANLETAHGLRVGDLVPTPSLELRRGDRGISECGPRRYICCVRVPKDEAATMRGPAPPAPLPLRGRVRPARRRGATRPTRGLCR